MAIPVDLEPSAVAPVAMNDARTAGPHEMCELLRGLASIMSGDRDELSLVQHDLRELIDRLVSASRAELDAVQIAGAFLVAPLQATLARCAPRGRLLRRDVRELRAMLRSLTCMVDRSGGAAHVTPLAPEVLALRYTRSNLAALVLRAEGAFAALAAERDVGYACSAPDALWAEVDPDKIEAVVVNLVFNAFKHTPPGGRIECVLAEADREQVLLRVSDTGPAISRARAEGIFDRARRIDRDARLCIEGIGCNLGMARDLVAMHGGTLTLEPRAGAGAVFELRIPRRAPRGLKLHTPTSTASSVAADAADAAARELRAEATLHERQRLQGDRRSLVLLLEASRSLQRVMVESLEPEHATVCAFTRHEAIELARRLEPDLIIADRVLLEVGEAPETALARWPGREQTPILALAERSDASAAVRLLEHGAQELVYKPFLASELRARARNLVAGKRTRDLLNEAVGQRDTDLVRLAGTVARHQRELARAVDDLQHARHAAEDANQIKRNFLRIMSHELKTPITAMQLHMRLLERDPDAGVSPKVRDGLDRIGRASRRLLHLIDTVLEWARVESGRCQLSMEELDLPSMVAAVAAELEAYAKQKQVAIEMRTTPAIVPCAIGDRRLVQLLIVNLLTRAVQVTPRGRVEVTIGFAEPSRHWIEVRDGSPQIPPAERAAIFDPLRPVKGLQEYSGSGSGLGLHVVRDIARAFDGDIALIPTDGPGNTFVLKLAAMPLERTTARIVPALASESTVSES